MSNIAKNFGATNALHNVTISAFSCEVTAIVGENGSGKSTLMEIAAGTYQADSGEMSLFGVRYSPRNPFEARKAGVVMVHQHLSLAPSLTVAENLFLGVEKNRLGWINNNELESQVDGVLSKFCHVDINAKHTVESLSGAAQQIVEIARAMASSARVLIFDEPTSGLSMEDVKQLFSIIRRLKEEGLAIIYITHFLEEVKEISDRVVILRDGEVVGAEKTADFSVDQIVSLMVGRPLKSFYPRTLRTPGKVLLEATNLGGVSKPVSASFSLRRGEVFGIAGLRDSGRTELLRCLFGLDPVRRGQVRIGGVIGSFLPKQSWSQGVGIMPEDRISEGLALALGIHDNITLTRLGEGLFGFFSPNRQIKITQRWMDLLGIRSSYPSACVSTLSGGNQQKAVLARLLHHDVDILLMDEPTKGIDVGAKETIYRLIDELATGSNGHPPKAVLIVSSYFPELLGICDRIAVMSRGQLGDAHNVSDVDQHSLMAEALCGLH